MQKFLILLISLSALSAQSMNRALTYSVSRVARAKSLYSVPMSRLISRSHSNLLTYGGLPNSARLQIINRSPRDPRSLSHLQSFWVEKMQDSESIQQEKLHSWLQEYRLPNIREPLIEMRQPTEDEYYLSGDYDIPPFIDWSEDKEYTSLKPLYLAIKKNLEPAIFKELLRQLTIKDLNDHVDFGNNFLQHFIDKYAISDFDPQDICSLIKIILDKSGVGINDFNESGQTVLHLLVRRYVEPYSFSPILGFLLSQGADLEAKDKYGKTPLFEAISDITDYSYDRFLMIKSLIEYGAHVNTQNNDGQSIVHNLMEDIKHTENTVLVYLDFLIKNGLDINIKDNNGRTALSKLIAQTPFSNNAIDYVKHLIEYYNADISVISPSRAFGRTLLLELSSFLIEGKGGRKFDRCFESRPNFEYMLEMAEYLVNDVGLDPNAKDFQGFTLLDRIELYCLRKKQTWYQDNFSRLSKESEALKNFLRKKDGGSSVLHHILRGIGEHGEISEELQSLVKNGLNINAKDKNGRTALSILLAQAPFMKGFIHPIKFLVENKADISVKSTRNDTLEQTLFLELFSCFVQRGCGLNLFPSDGQNFEEIFEIAKYLVDIGLNPNASDSTGRKALDRLDFFQVSEMEKQGPYYNSMSSTRYRLEKDVKPLIDYLDEKYRQK